MIETWNRVPGYAHVFASDAGRVKVEPYSDKRGHNLTERLLKQHRMENGYYTVCVRAIGEPRGYPRLVHRLVCMAFLGIPNEQMDTRHLDGTRDNNIPSNLQWGTAKENAADRVHHGTQLQCENVPTALLSNSEVVEIRRLCNEGKTVNRRIAEQFHVYPSTIYQIKYRKTYRAI